jgi:hypothetical protein
MSIHGTIIIDELDRQWFVRLREAEHDLQVELEDLAVEILSREARLVEVTAELRRVRDHMRQRLRDTAIAGAA